MRSNLVAGLLALVAAVPAAGQGYPERPIRLIVAFPPGGGTDVAARLIVPRLSEALGKQVVIDNRPGAGSTLGTNIVAKASADGYTLLMSDTTFGIVAALYPKLPYDAERDFAPVTQATSVPLAMVVHPSLPVNTIAEFVALAKAKPGQLNFGSGGVGTPLHMTGELLKIAAGIDIVHIPYKGAGPAFADLLGGHFQLMCPTMQSAIPYIHSGKLRALALTTAKRSPALPNVPTMAEAGYPAVRAVAWYGVHAPAGTPKAIVARLHTDIARTLQDPVVKERFTSEGAEVVGSTPAEFTQFIAAEITQWKKVVTTAGIKAEF
ncbi:MAG TPA: tripartite tricarboxylate transporter substrate binding protein [Burkholderiales bacterium]|nr:tripartite tricarboxylate transporter substrate binding protein [Burkholderiales bacterium]